MKRRIIAFTGLLVLFPVMLSAQENENQDDKESITCEQAYDLIQKFEGDTSFIILDTRPRSMFNDGHIAGAIYYDVFSQSFDSWVGKYDRDMIFLLYCSSGYRSEIALDKMKQMGFRNLYHMYEGIETWRRKGFVVIKN